MRMPKALKHGRLLALLVLIGVLALRTLDPVGVSLLRFRSFDILQQLFRRVPQEQPVAIVDVDDESLRAIGQWPWPRTIFANLVDRLTAMGAAVIGFDVLFAEPDRLSPAVAAKVFAGLDPAIYRALDAMPSNDALLAAAMARSRVVLGEAAKERDIGGNDGPSVKTPVATLGGDPRAHLMHFRGLVRAVPELETAAAGRGMVTIIPDRDGIVRRVPLILSVADDLFSSLSFEMLRITTGQTVTVRSGPSGIEEIIVGPHLIQTDHRGQVWVRFAEHERQLYISAKDILNGSADPARIRGKMILVGTSATGLGDIKTTPLDAALPGVEVHAQLLETVLTGRYLTRPDWADGLELFLTAFIGLVMIVLVPIAGPRLTLLILVVIGAFVVGGTIYLYFGQDFMVDGSLPLVAAGALYSFLVYANLARETRQRRQIRSAFGQYLSSALVEQLANDPSKLKLGGERRHMTFLFSDIRGFTAISERYKDDPVALTHLINRYMTPMTNAILQYGGTIDKYMGDAIMAFWNAPLDDREHARHACLAALEMLTRLDKLNGELAEEATIDPLAYHASKLAIGIGINTGDCIVGNMGSDLRFDYSVLGDAVNLAARLETQSKNYGVIIVIGEETRTHVADFACIELDLIAVKGKSEAAHIFTLVGDQSVARTPSFLDFLDRHERMLAAYRARQWENARLHLTACREMNYASYFTSLFDLYQSRISGFEKKPPPASWRGVHLAETK